MTHFDNIDFQVNWYNMRGNCVAQTATHVHLQTRRRKSQFLIVLENYICKTLSFFVENFIYKYHAKYGVTIMNTDQ